MPPELFGAPRLCNSIELLVEKVKNQRSGHMRQRWKTFAAVLTLVVAFLLCAAARDAQAKEAEIGAGHPIVGLQLFSLKAEMAKDMPGALKLARQMGIREVEASRSTGQSPDEYRKALDDAGLVCTSAHIPYGQLQHDFDKSVKEAKTLGAKYVVCAWIPHQTTFSIEEANAAAANFNKWGKALAEQGMTMAYHPHGFEFAPTPNGTAFDVLVRETDPKLVVFEMDVFWAFHAGQDPVKLMEKYPDRFAMLHLKDMKKGTPTGVFTGNAPKETSVAVGSGQIDFPALLAEAKKIGVKHYYIEDEAPDAAKQIPESLKYLKTLNLPPE
jgi:sugar phosphate isomerase/epimerase